MVHGRNPVAPIVLALLAPINPGRFRDAWVEKRGDGSVVLALYTRNGGGNREHYNDEKEAGPECDCTGCTMTYAIPAHSLYLSDKDDDFDCTYATVYFRVPEDAGSRLKALGAPEDFKVEDLAQPAPDMAQRWQKVIDAIAGKTGAP